MRDSVGMSPQGTSSLELVHLYLRLYLAILKRYFGMMFVVTSDHIELLRKACSVDKLH